MRFRLNKPGQDKDRIDMRIDKMTVGWIVGVFWVSAAGVWAALDTAPMAGAFQKSGNGKTVLAGTDDEFHAAVLRLSEVDERPSGKRVFVAGVGLRGAVESGIGQVDHVESAPGKAEAAI